MQPLIRPILAACILAAFLLPLAVILANLAGENVDAGNPAHLRPVTAWPWEN